MKKVVNLLLVLVMFVGITNVYAQQTDAVKEKRNIRWQFGKWAQLETLLHEQVHLWQQNFGENPVKPDKQHTTIIKMV